MKTFSRLSLFFALLSITLMLVGGTADAQEPFLEVIGSEGFDGSPNVGDRIRVIFQAGFDGKGQMGISLRLAVTTASINVTSPLPVSRPHMTGPGGVLIVEGTFTQPDVNASIEAVWGLPAGGELRAKASNDAGDHPAPLVIVVNSPKDVNNQKLQSAKIGDTFTQEITIENRDSKRSSLPLSAWQMDVVYNPLILEVVDVAEGDFLDIVVDEGENIKAVYAAMMKSGKISVSQARAGQMANASPPPANVASAPSPAGIKLEPGDKETLLTITFKVLAVAEEALGIHNVRLQSSLDRDKLPDLNKDGISDDLDGDGKPSSLEPDRISYSILVSDVFVATQRSSQPVDVNQDGDVNILDLVEVAGSIGMVPGKPRADVNGDGFVNVLDLITIYMSEHWAGSVALKDVTKVNEVALPAPSVERNVGPDTIQSWIDLARIEDDGSAIFDLGIANLEALLAFRIPTETRLLLNYPNPFNPETWIPYQLAEATKVTVTIHAMNGSLIRTLELGHQAAGTYKSKSQAAYWDGRNEFGEQVASGLYFYTLTAGDFSATHKMLVRK